MREVNIAEAKTSLSDLLQAVAAGEEIVITKRNKPIARLLPFQEPKARPTFGMAKKSPPALRPRPHRHRPRP
jgi:prevent-host-death family protein